MPAKNEYGLTPQQERFAQTVASGKNLSDAYRSAYKAEKMKPEVINVKASELAALGTVSVRIRSLQSVAAERAVIDNERILREIDLIATSDIAGIMHEDGRVKLPHELDPATRAAVKSFKNDEYGRIEYTLWDKNAALVTSVRCRGLFEKDNAQKSGVLDHLPREVVKRVMDKLKQIESGSTIEGEVIGRSTD